jgi:ABC-type Fe3+ transport system substrate-binding protein
MSVFGRFRRALLLGSGALALGLIAGCGGDTPTPTPTSLPSLNLVAIAERDAKLQAGAIYRELGADWVRTLEVERLYKEAQSEGEVVYYTYEEDQGKSACAAFMAEFPEVRCRHQAIPASSITTVFVTEREAGETSADVLNLAMSHTAQLVDRGYIDELDWEPLGVDPRRVWSANPQVPGNAAGAFQNQYAHFYNADLIDEEDLPQTLFDWLDPKYKGKICASDFLFRAGSGFSSIYHGVDAMVQLAKELIEQNDMVVTSACEPLVVSGERPLYYMGYGNPPSVLRDNLVFQFWNDGLGANLFSSMVSNAAPNPSAARLFAAFTTSKAASSAVFEASGLGWTGYGDASEELVSGKFAGAQIVYESPVTFRERVEWQTEFSGRVFPGAR